MKIKTLVILISMTAITASCHSFSQRAVDLSVQEFEAGIGQSNSQLLDVRTPKEYNSGHLKNSFLADWSDKKTFIERVQYLDKDKPVYTYCLSGGRSSAAAAWLKENGFKVVHNLDGGLIAWKSYNKAVEGQSLTQQISIGDFLKSIPGNKTVLVDVGAQWCPPCKKMEPVIKELSNNNSNLFEVISVDGGEQETLAKELNAESFPTFIIYKDGKEVWRKQGIVSKEEFLSQLK